MGGWSGVLATMPHDTECSPNVKTGIGYDPGMCGRFTHQYTWQEVHDFLSLTFPAHLELPPRFNVAPTQAAPIVHTNGESQRGMTMALWGLKPAWVDRPGPINARAETVATNGMFKAAFVSRRCVVPVSGFYEWQKVGNGSPEPSLFSESP